MVLAKAQLLQSDYYCMETFAAWSKSLSSSSSSSPTLVVTYVKRKRVKKKTAYKTETRENLWAQSFGSIFIPPAKGISPDTANNKLEELKTT